MFHETPKSSMEQSFKAGYMTKLDKTFEFHETKFHRVVWALLYKLGVQVVIDYTGKTGVYRDIHFFLFLL